VAYDGATLAGVTGESLGWLRELARLVVPVVCAGCGVPDEPCCLRCTALLGGTPRRVEAAAPRLDRLDGDPPLPVWALVDYAGPVRDLVVAWKVRGRLDVDGLLAGAGGAPPPPRGSGPFAGRGGGIGGGLGARQAAAGARRAGAVHGGRPPGTGT
jgi:hypothetical protein